MIQNKYINSSGALQSYNGFEASEFVEIPEGAVAVKGRMNTYKPGANDRLCVAIAFYSESYTFLAFYNDMSEILGTAGDNKWGLVYAIIPAGAKYIRCCDVYNHTLAPGLPAEECGPRLYFEME